MLRNVTERPEGVDVGTLKLAGNDPAKVKTLLMQLLSDHKELETMRSLPNPYGDGHAGKRIAQAVAWRLGLCERPEDWQALPLEKSGTPDKAI